jgi:hypothetical protein
MIISEKKIGNTRIVTEATCDCCGADCMKEIWSSDVDGDSDEKDIVKTFEGMELEAFWGYGSSDEKDGEVWTAIICEDCVKKHLEEKITFLKERYL